jgi:hypothetical protein
MNDQRVPLEVSVSFVAAFVMFRGCFQFINTTYLPCVYKVFDILYIVVVIDEQREPCKISFQAFRREIPRRNRCIGRDIYGNYRNTGLFWHPVKSRFDWSASPTPVTESTLTAARTRLGGR